MSTHTEIAPETRVKNGHTVIQKLRDDWLSCGREPMKTHHKEWLDKATAQRGTLREWRDGESARFAVVDWDDGSESQCLPYRIQTA